MTAMETGVPVPARDRGRIAPVRLAHVVLKTSNKAAMVHFYRHLLEAEVTFGDDKASFLTYDEEHHRIAIIEMPALGRGSRRRAGMDHVAFTYASLSDLLLTYERLKSEGIEPAWCTHHGGTLSLYYADPDANFCELQIDVFHSAADLNRYLQGEDFRTNPIGVDFDPDDLLRRFHAGEAEATLLARRTDGPRDMATMPRAYLGNFHWMMIQLASRLGLGPR